MDRPNLDVRLEQATQAILARYPAIPEVDSIFLMDNISDIQVYVMLDIPVYDDALMDRLLDQEFEIQKEMESIYFQYIPVGKLKPRDRVPEVSIQIYGEQ